MTSPMKVGALARRTGLSVRTLHHYDDVGLLVPSARTASGHRLYAHADVARLHQIQALRITGIPLDEIRRLLAGEPLSPQQVIQMHLDRLYEQIAAHTRLVDQLQRLARHPDTMMELTTEALCQLIDDMTKLDSYFTLEQIATIKVFAAETSQPRMQQIGNEWAAIIPAVRHHMQHGTAPTDTAVQALGVRWRALVNEFTGSDQKVPAIRLRASSRHDYRRLLHHRHRNRGRILRRMVHHIVRDDGLRFIVVVAARVQVAIKAREIAARDFDTKTMPRCEIIAGIQGLQRHLVHLPVLHHHWCFIVSLTIAHALNRFVEIVCATVRIHIDNLDGEVGVFRIGRYVQGRRNRSTQLRPFFERFRRVHENVRTRFHLALVQ